MEAAPSRGSLGTPVVELGSSHRRGRSQGVTCAPSQTPPRIQQGPREEWGGHDLWRGFGCVVCLQCCYYAGALSRKLSEPCNGPVSMRSETEKHRARRRDRILLGLHPDTKQRLY